MLHLMLHILVPFAVAVGLRQRAWVSAFFPMIAGLAIDLDHLLATPIYDAARCSIGFHPLHTLLPICVYTALLVWPKTRLVGLGLCIHIVLDAADCWF